MNLDPRFFNDLFYEILLEYAINDKPFTCFKGSAGSGKSYSIQQYIIISCLQNKQKWLVLRAFATNIRDSIEDVFITILESLDLEENIDYKHNKSTHTINFKNGSVILMKGLDSVEKLKSISNISNVFIEEATELEDVSVDPISIIDQLNFRLRGKSAIGIGRGNIFLAFNPTSENNFMKKLFYDIDRNDCNYSNTTYLDNKFLGDLEEYAARFDYLKAINENIWRVYLLGDWGTTLVLNKMFVSFDFKKHTIDNFNYDPNRELILSFDENVAPFCTLLLAQYTSNEIVIFDEICVSGNIYETMEFFYKKYNNHKGIIKIYGDSTSDKNNTQGNKFYRIIQNFLNEKSYTNRLLIDKSNPNVLTRINWINYLMLSDNDIRIRISKNCTILLRDIINIQWDKNGTNKNKEKEKGESFEKYGHCFTGETLIETDNGAVRIDKIKIGDKVLTRKGYKKVLNVFNNGLRDVKTYLIGNETIKCTPDHNFLIDDIFKPISKASEAEILTIYDKESKTWKKKLLSIVDSMPEYLENEKRIVYDIEVEDEHEYFANNILVHNCSDALEYMLTGIYKSEYQRYITGNGKMIKSVGQKKFNNKY